MLFAGFAGIVGIALGYFLRLVIALGKKGSMELSIKQAELKAKEQAQKVITEDRKSVV